MGKLRNTIDYGGVNGNQNLSRIDAYSYTMDPIVYNDHEVTKSSIMSEDFYPMMKKKYHSTAPHVYKHYYSEPPHSPPKSTTTYIYKKSSKPSKPHRNNDDEFFDFNLFDCDDDDDDDYSDESGSNESGLRRRRSRNRNRNRNRRKKKKLLKILLFIGLLLIAKMCFHKMMHHYFPALDSTTGRDEEPIHEQIFHNDIDIDNDGGFYAKSQDLSIQHRSIFAPNYDETQMI
ncbi:unnamed protein product [Diamesa serratosioi]